MPTGPAASTLAQGGTLFLDEIGEVPLKNQVDLLRVLESREYQPLGATQVQKADVRIIAATNRDLERSVTEHHFRDDLYYRLNVVPIDVPPLRQRREDIPLLLELFLEDTCRAHGQSRKQLTPDGVALLANYDWPGNVRELRNLIQRLVVTTSGPSLGPPQINAILGEGSRQSNHLTIELGSTIKAVEAQLIRHTLERITPNRREAATILGISVRALQYKLKLYNIP